MGCAKVCDCNYTVDNTGIGCNPIMKVEKRAWIMNEVDSTGALNYIDLAVTLNDAYFVALINNADPLKRIFPLPEVKDISDLRGEPIVHEWKDGTQVYVRDGVRKYTGMFPPDSASPQLTGILEGQRCAKPAKFTIDADGTIWGRISDDGTKLYPVKMDANSVSAVFIKPTDTEPQMLGWSFNFHPSEKDCKLRGIPIDELSGGINPLYYDGLVDVFAKVISCTTTKLTVKLYNMFGTPINPETIKGLLVSNFALYNVTTSTTIALTGTGSLFTESPSGTYELKYATASVPVSTNVLRLTPTKNGYDFKAVVTTSIIVS